MALSGAAKGGYELTEIDRRPVLFTSMCLNRNIVSTGIFYYDVQDSGVLDGSMAEIKAVVVVNHWGAILCEDLFPVDEYGSHYPKNWGYPGKNMSPEEFQEAGREQLTVYLLPEVLQTEPIMQKSLP